MQVPDDRQHQNEDPYMKAWKEWIERDKQGRLEKARRLEKQQKMTQSWE